MDHSFHFFRSFNIHEITKVVKVTHQQVRQVDTGADERSGGAVVLLVAAEDDLVQVRNDLERLAGDEQHRYRNLNFISLLLTRISTNVYFCDFHLELVHL